VADRRFSRPDRSDVSLTRRFRQTSQRPLRSMGPGSEAAPVQTRPASAAAVDVND
jgi:hypothetical protein